MTHKPPIPPDAIAAMVQALTRPPLPDPIIDRGPRRTRKWHGLTKDEKNELRQWAHPEIIDRIETLLKDRNP